MHHEAMPHGVSQASGIDAALVTPEAGAVGKAVGHGLRCAGSPGKDLWHRGASLADHW